MKDRRFRIVPIPSDFASSVRAHAAPMPVRDGARHQCRHCLTLSQADETVLLASYVPFSTDQPYAERGPVFIHERECERYATENEYPAEFPKRSAVLRAYDAGERMIAAEPVGERRVEDVIDMLLSDPRVSTLHARNLAEGCFMFRVERAAIPSESA